MNGMLPLLPWRYALHSLQEMPERKLQRDQVTYNAVLKTLEKKWQSLCLHVLQEFHSTAKPAESHKSNNLIDDAMALKSIFVQMFYDVSMANQPFVVGICVPKCFSLEASHLFYCLDDRHIPEIR